MKRESRDAWARRVTRWEKSGLSRDEFAAREAVRSRTLGWWRWFLAKHSSRPPMVLAKREAFVELEPIVIESAGERIEVALGNGRVVRVPAAFNDEVLGRVITVAERR